MTDRIGQQLGNYRLIRRLGEGGFAEVYQGEHIYLKTEAAIKVLHTRLATDDMDSFVSEAQTIARLKHPQIVRVLEFGLEGSTPFLVMDYAPNGTLRQRHRKGTRLDPAIILPYVKQVAEALQYAHDQKLVHRDVKPENMLIGERDEVLLSDFGIATVAQSSRYQGTQEVAGTVAYMAPEQVQGKPRPASDQYALGIVIYEWLAGERPFHGSFTEIATQHVLTPPPPLREKLPDIAPALEEVVLIALAKDSKERFGSVRAFATAFEHACKGAALHFAPTQRISPPDLVTRPEAASPPPAPVSPPISGHAPPPDLPSTVAAPPSRAPARPSLPSRETPPPIPAAATPQETRRPRPRTSRSRIIIVGSLLLALILVASGVALVLINNTSGVNNTSTFHQQVTTGPDITSIHVGTGVNASSGTIQGETDTFHAGDTVYVTCTVSHAPCVSPPASRAPSSYTLTAALFQGDNPVPSNLYYGVTGSPDVSFSASVTATGVYKWVLSYNGTPEASITFQVVS